MRTEYREHRPELGTTDWWCVADDDCTVLVMECVSPEDAACQAAEYFEISCGEPLDELRIVVSSWAGYNRTYNVTGDYDRIWDAQLMEEQIPVRPNLHCCESHSHRASVLMLEVKAFLRREKIEQDSMVRLYLERLCAEIKRLQQISV